MQIASLKPPHLGRSDKLGVLYFGNSRRGRHRRGINTDDELNRSKIPGNPLNEL